MPRRWLAILADHSHGAALAAAIRREGGEKPTADACGEEDAEALEELLDALERSL